MEFLLWIKLWENKVDFVEKYNEIGCEKWNPFLIKGNKIYYNINGSEEAFFNHLLLLLNFEPIR